MILKYFECIDIDTRPKTISYESNSYNFQNFLRFQSVLRANDRREYNINGPAINKSRDELSRKPVVSTHPCKDVDVIILFITDHKVVSTEEVSYTCG